MTFWMSFGHIFYPNVGEAFRCLINRSKASIAGAFRQIYWKGWFDLFHWPRPALRPTAELQHIRGR